MADLEIAWEYHAGDVHDDLLGIALQSTPLVVGDTIYLCPPKNEVIALDPVTGEERWRFAPVLQGLTPILVHYTTCRGLRLMTPPDWAGKCMTQARFFEIFRHPMKSAIESRIAILIL